MPLPISIPRFFPLSAETLDKGHGRLEHRRLSVSSALNDYLDFPHAGQVGRLQRHVTELKSGRQYTETVFLITDLNPEQASPERLLALARGHWGIENRSHYVRDVTFDEDRSTVRRHRGPAAMAALRNFAISLLRLAGVTNIARATRALAGQPRSALAMLGI
jgi:hypothetical protein